MKTSNSLIALFLIAMALSAGTPSWSQTPAELARVKKITKNTRQTKSSSLLMLAGLAEAKGDYKKAKDYYGKILTIYKNDPGIGPASAKYAYMMAKEAQCDFRVGKKDLAIKRCKEALAIAEARRSDPKEYNFFLGTRQACGIVLGKNMPKSGKVAAKIPVPELKTIPSSDIHDLAEREKEVKKFMAQDKSQSSPEQVKRTLYLANVYTLEKKYSNAEPLFKKVISDIEKKNGKFSPQLLTPLSNYGYLLKQQGKQQEADAVLKRMQLMTGQRKK